MTCTSEGCTRPVRNQTYGLCKHCNTKRLNAGTCCAYGDCERPVKSRGLCNTHHSYWLTGKIQVDVPEAYVKKTKPKKAVTFKRVRICVYGHCPNTAKIGEFCYHHRGDTRFDSSPICRVEGCQRVATFIPNTGACVEHGVKAA